MLLPSTLPVCSNTCGSPPAFAARGREGFANRRSLVARTGPLCLGAAVCPRGAALRVSLRFGALVAGRVVSDAAWVGAASCLGSASSLAISCGETLRGLGDG